MDTTATELRYLELIEAYSSKELKRLPVELQRFRFDLPQLLAATENDFSLGFYFEDFISAVEALRTSVELQADAKFQLKLIEQELAEANIERHRKFLRRRITRADLKIQRLMEQSSAIYERVLAEYLFICRTVELNELISLKRIDLMETKSAQAMIGTMALTPEEAELIAAAQTSGIRSTTRAIRAMAESRLSTAAQILEEKFSLTEVNFGPVPQKGVAL